MILQALFVYSKACMASIMRQQGGQKELFHSGAAIQCGAFVGGVTGFLLVNIFNLFKRAPPCMGY